MVHVTYSCTRPCPCSLLPAPRSPLPAPRSPLPAPRSPLPAPRSPLPAPRSPLPAPRSPLPAPRSPLPAPRSLPSDPSSPDNLLAAYTAPTVGGGGVKVEVSPPPARLGGVYTEGRGRAVSRTHRGLLTWFEV